MDVVAKAKEELADYDLSNMVGMANEDAAREGDNTKCAMYVENIAEVLGINQEKAEESVEIIKDVIDVYIRCAQYVK